MDIYFPVGGDAVVDQNGGLAPAVGWDEFQQQMQRFLITNPQGTDERGLPITADYLWHPTYGLGLRSMLGTLLTPSQLTAMTNACRMAALSQPAVAQNPPPVIQFIAANHSITFLILCYLANQTPGTQPVGMAYEVNP